MANSVKQKVLDVEAALDATLESLGVTKQKSDERNKRLSETIDMNIEDPKDLEFIELPENDLLNRASEVAMQLMSGELAPDVKKQIERFSAEIATQGGFGLSQAASNLTASSIGQTSTGMMNTGTQLATGIGEIRERSALGEANLNQRIAEFNTKTRQAWTELEMQNNKWRDTFTLGINELDLGRDKFKLAVYDLVSRNQNTTQTLIAELIISNSRKGIKGLQDNIDQFNQNIFGTNTNIGEDFDLLDLEPLSDLEP